MVKLKRFVFTEQWLEKVLSLFGTIPCGAKIKTMRYDPDRRVLDIQVESSFFYEVAEGAEPEIEEIFWSSS